ncbi:MAG: Helicase/secretion neighborhood CpaE-like protein [Frankiales bacterium]|nr:Helicase/secretion neighborhood CpaE-like protein [Frankiales bacterium]
MLPAARSLVVLSRPLVVTAEADVLDDLVRLAATAGTELDVAPDAGTARRSWATAPFVVVAVDALPGLLRARLPRREGVVLLGRDVDDPDVWQRAVAIGAEHVVLLPDAEQWLTDRFADATESFGPVGALVAVVGGRGGAGATTLACALAMTASRSGRPSLLVDGDPLGGGIDLVFGGEAHRGVRWPDLGATRGRVPAAALDGALPRMAGLSVLSWGRGDAGAVPVEAVRAVLAAGRRCNELVVVDLPRALDECSRAVLASATTVLLVVPNEVRAAAAASRVAAAVAVLCSDLRVVTRGPSPTGLTGVQVAEALGLPLVADLRAEPGLDAALERGEAPGRRPRGPLGMLCSALVAELLPPVLEQAA